MATLTNNTGRIMESTTITYAGMKLDIDYDVDKHGDLECITDVTHEGVSIIDFCACMLVSFDFEPKPVSFLWALEQLVQKEIDRETGPDEFEGWREGQ